MRHLPADAPENEPILVWVADVSPVTRKPTGWKMGKCWGRGAKARLLADGYNGNWDIPYWHPLPEDPK